MQNIDITLKKYIHKFAHLRQGITKYGKAPHKPILLLAIIDEIEKGNIATNKVFITTNLVALFKENWSLLVNTSHKAEFTLPFYHLSGEKFWHLTASKGGNVNTYSGSFQIFSQMVEYGMFEEELFALLSQTNTRNYLKTVLLNTYFPITKQVYISQKKSSGGYIYELEKFILNELSLNYSISPLPVEDEEEMFVRGGLFKKLIPQVYNFTCSISGMRLHSLHGFSMVAACHIIPFSISKDDKVTNGIALCPNLHRAFDRGLISIDKNYRVLVSPSFSEDEDNSYSLRKLVGRKLMLPFGNIHYPALSNVEWHNVHIFKN